MTQVRIEDFLDYFRDEIAGSIVRKQTTYVDLCIDSAATSEKQYRIHFDHKQEFGLDQICFRSISLFEDHPLLLDYQEPTVDVHLDGLVSRKQSFAKSLDDLCQEVFDGWRGYEHYLNLPLDTFLERPYGLLLTGPKSFADRVIEIAPEFNVQLFIRNKRKPKGIFKTFLFDEMYVIAKDFRIEVI